MTSLAPTMRSTRFYLIVGLVVAIHLASASWHVFFGALNTDEGFYAVATRAVAQGEVPYRDFGFPQPPLVLYANCLPLRLLGFGLFPQRILNGLWGGLAVLLAARWVSQSTRPAWGVALAVMFSLSSPWMYFIQLGKTYAWTALVATISTGIFLHQQSSARRVFWLTLLGAIGVSSRLPTAPFFLILIFFSLWRNGKIDLSFVTASLAGGMLGSLPLLACWWAAPAEMQFWVLDLHRFSLPHRTWQLAAPEILTLAPALWVLTGVAIIATVRKKLWSSREAVVLLAAIAGLAANLLPRGVYEEYAIPFLPVLAMASAALFFRFGCSTWSWSCHIWLAVTLVVFQFATAPVLFWQILPERRATVNWWLPFNAPPYNCELPAQLAAARNAVMGNLQPGAPFLGPNLILAAETGHAVPPDLRMGPFALTTDVPPDEAARFHLATPALLNRWFDRPEVTVWGLFDRPVLNYSWSMPSFSSLPKETRGPWVEKWGHAFGIAYRGGDFVVLRRRPEKASSASP